MYTAVGNNKKTTHTDIGVIGKRPSPCKDGRRLAPAPPTRRASRCTASSLAARRFPTDTKRVRSPCRPSRSRRRHRQHATHHPRTNSPPTHPCSNRKGQEGEKETPKIGYVWCKYVSRRQYRPLTDACDRRRSRINNLTGRRSRLRPLTDGGIDL